MSRLIDLDDTRNCYVGMDGEYEQWNIDPNVLAEAQPEQRWIPCSELPDTDRNVFVARGKNDNMSVCIGHYDHDYKQWYEDRNWFALCLYDGVYWCEMPPLPEPYREEGENE